MSLVDHLLSTRTPLELAKKAVATAKENAALRQRAHELEVELFWMKARERDDVARLCFMIDEECYVYQLDGKCQLGWEFEDMVNCRQSAWYDSPRDAIDAQMAHKLKQDRRASQHE